MSLAKEMLEVAAEIRERSRPSPCTPHDDARAHEREEHDWPATAQRIQDEIAQLMRQYGPKPQTPPTQVERLKTLLKLVVAEL